MGDLILGKVSRLYAFSAYPNQTSLPCRAAGATTGSQEVCSARSSRTKAKPPPFAGAGRRGLQTLPPSPHILRELRRPGGHSEGPNTRSHPELGRENPQRQWYCASRRGRVGRRQALQASDHRNHKPEQIWPSSAQPHSLLPLASAFLSSASRGVEQPGSSSGS